MIDFQVICRSLGFPLGGLPSSPAFFGYRSSPHSLYNLFCSSRDINITKCNISIVNNPIKSSDGFPAASVQCGVNKSGQCCSLFHSIHTLKPI